MAALLDGDAALAALDADAAFAALARLLRRPDFLDGVFESGRCASEPGAAAAFDVAAVLDLLDASASVAGCEAGAPEGGPPRRGVDYELGRWAPPAWERYAGAVAAGGAAAAARAALAGGYSVTIRHAELRSRRLAAACFAVQDFLGLPAQANVYATPPDASAARPHVDRHCVFAVQLAGAKRWCLREADEYVPPPARERATARADAAYGGERAVDLAAGGALYVPRGAPHCCENAGDALSVHVSFGVDVHAPLTWEGALQAALRGAGAAPGAHAALRGLALGAAPFLRHACLHRRAGAPERLRREAARALGVVEALDGAAVEARATDAGLAYLGLAPRAPGAARADALAGLRAVVDAPAADRAAALRDVADMARDVRDRARALAAALLPD